MKKLATVLLFFAAAISRGAWACPVCERQQPKVLRGIVHGNTPDSSWDYVIVGGVALITLFTLYYSVKWLIRPGETDKEHIKYHILNNE